MKKLRIVTRSSKLALAQVDWVKNKLNNFYPDLDFDILKITTHGDKFLEAPLYKVGGKGLFVKELDDVLIQGEADIAIHSVKDVPQILPDALILPVLCEREDPCDAWISPQSLRIEQLAAGANVGTSSLRRIVQLRRVRSDLNYISLRGNVPTRVAKCQSGDFDAIVLAKAGLTRLEMSDVITHVFPPQILLPAVGQGAIGIVCHKAAEAVQALIAPLNHLSTHHCVMAERVMNKRLHGSCQVPIAGYAFVENESITLTGRVGHPDTTEIIEASCTMPFDAFEALGNEVAEQLIAQGALSLIASFIKANE